MDTLGHSLDMPLLTKKIKANETKQIKRVEAGRMGRG
jgi:hypothetical protein